MNVLRHTARKIILRWKQEIRQFSKGRIFLILWKYSTSPNHSHSAAEDNAETVWFIQRGHHGQLQRYMSSIQKHLSLHLLMHGLYHSHAERKCRFYGALEQGSSFDWILVLTTVKSAGHSVPNHFSQLSREKVSGPARNRWTWKPCPPAITQCLTRHDPTLLRIHPRFNTIIIPYTFQNGQDQEDIWIISAVQLRTFASLGFAGQDPLTPIWHIQFRNPFQTPRLSSRSKCFEYFHILRFFLELWEYIFTNMTVLHK